MSIELKLPSVRCDLHPPLSAQMYCSHCKTFLCRICAEVRPGGRVCVSCKQPCTQPNASEFAQLIAQRTQAKENARLAKEAESRIKVSTEKAKQERDARLKSEFAIKKAEWAQREAQKKKATPSAANWNTVEPAVATEPAPAPLPGSQPRMKTADPLATLGERGHLATIGKAKNWMLFVAILTMLVNGVFYYLLAGAESLLDVADTGRHARQEELARHPKKKVANTTLRANSDGDDEAETAANFAAGDAISASAHASLFWAKLIIFAYFAVGATLLGFYFWCDSKPMEATQYAFWLYASVTAIDVLFAVFSHNTNMCGLCLRVSALMALFKGMQAGAELQKLRTQYAEAT